jgi:hypothetical protein
MAEAGAMELSTGALLLCGVRASNSAQRYAGEGASGTADLPLEHKVTRFRKRGKREQRWLDNQARLVHDMFLSKGAAMATNPPKGDDHRKGAVRDRSQTYNPKTEQFVKRDTNSGRFLDVKQDGNKFKGVRREK